MLPKYIRFIMTAGIWLASLACQPQKPQTGSNLGGGSVIGNGFLHYQSPLYGYQITYPKILNLVEHKPELVTVGRPGQDEVTTDTTSNNSAEQVASSGMTFAVVALATNDLIPVLAYATAANPDAPWVDADIGGAPGFRADRTDGQAAWTKYVLRLSSDHLLVITIKTSGDSDFQQELQGVLATFSYDLASPRLLSLQFIPDHIEAGQPFHIRLRAVDDQSGVNADSFGNQTLVDRGLVVSTCLTLESSDQALTIPKLCGHAVASADHWLDLAVSTAPFTTAGIYRLGTFSLVDNTGNLSTAMLQGEQYRVFRQHAGHVPDDCVAPRDQADLPKNCYDDLPAPALTLTNSAPAATPPQVQNVSLTATAVAGSTATLNFTVGDLSAGAGLDWSFYANGFVWLRAGSSVRQDFGPLAVAAAGPPELIGKVAGGNQFRVQLPLPSHMPAGVYQLSDFPVADLAGNQVTVHTSTTIQITSDGIEDRTPPQILAVSVSSPTAKAGDSVTLKIHAVDPLATIVGRSFTDDGSGCQDFSQEDVKTLGAYRATPIQVCTGTLQSLGEDWYGVKFTIGRNVEAGHYKLTSLSLYNAMGYSETLTSPNDDASTVFAASASDAPAVANVYLDVER